jgi:hypothetical protein
LLFITLRDENPVGTWQIVVFDHTYPDKKGEFKNVQISFFGEGPPIGKLKKKPTIIVPPDNSNHSSSTSPIPGLPADTPTAVSETKGIGFIVIITIPVVLFFITILLCFYRTIIDFINTRILGRSNTNGKLNTDYNFQKLGTNFAEDLDLDMELQEVDGVEDDDDNLDELLYQ